MKVWPRLRDARMKATWLLALVLAGVIVWHWPRALESVALVTLKMAIGAIVGMWIDRGVFPYARPSFKEPYVGWMFRRAAVVIAGMLAGAIGV